MKRRDLIQHLEAQGCAWLREGKKHSVYMNPRNRRQAAVPRHTEIAHGLCVAICKELGIPKP